MLAEYPQFIQIHRAFLVNMAYIQKLTRQSMMMDSGSSLPVPHGKYGAIKERFLSFLFEQEHMR